VRAARHPPPTPSARAGAVRRISQRGPGPRTQPSAGGRSGRMDAAYQLADRHDRASAAGDGILRRALDDGGFLSHAEIRLPG
jgi:hypothetical protein